MIAGRDINTLPDLQYIELIIDIRPITRPEIYAVIDYGQPIRFGTFRQFRVQDEQGRDKLFGSEMDVFNFLYKNGWIHETTFGTRDTYVYHIFRRRIKME